ATCSLTIGGPRSRDPGTEGSNPASSRGESPEHDQHASTAAVGYGSPRPLLGIRPAGETRQPIDRRQSLAQPANYRNAVLAQLRHQRPIHDPRPGVQQIARLAALRRGTGKQVDIPAYQLGRIER